MNRTDPIASDWHGLAQEVARLHHARAHHAKQLAGSDADRAAAAADRARVSGALAAIWNAVVGKTDELELQASHAEIRHDLAGIRETLALRLARSPSEDLADQLGRIDALIAHHEPWQPGADVPHILFLHDCNQEIRRSRARPAPAPEATPTPNPGGDHVNRSAERAPLRQAAARQTVAAATTPQFKQAGLF